jgi:hypothetical protein
MRATFRVLDAYRVRDNHDRIRALKAEADRDPHGHGKFFLAIALWEEDDLNGAYELAKPLLEESPEVFDLLAICLAFHLRSGDEREADTYARRLAVAGNPGRSLRFFTSLMNVLTLPLRLAGFGRFSHAYADVLDAWAQWAHDYVVSHPPVETGPNTSLERIREP